MGVARFLCAVVVLSAAVAGATVSTAAVTRPAIDRALLAPIDALVVAMNRSDDRAIAELMIRDAVIMDEVAPYRWTGPNAEEHWSHDDGLSDPQARRYRVSQRSRHANFRSSQRDARIRHRAARVRLHGRRKAPARDGTLDDRHGENGRGLADRLARIR
jgi:hypothetical protein